MWWTLGFSVVAAAVIFVPWYGLCLRWNRSRAQKLLAIIESAFLAHGRMNGVEWNSASEFRVRLLLSRCAFTNTTITIRMSPRGLPLSWLLDAFHRRRETLTFEANLLCPPGFNLEVQNQRWLVRTKSRSPRKSCKMKRLGPFILTSRCDWQREITNMVRALSASRDCELLSVSFRRRAPHFSATVPLTAIAASHCSPVRIFDALRELASGASAAKF